MSDISSEEWIRLSGSDPFRPRDEWDQWTNPESLRGQALALMDALDDASTKIEAAITALPWYRRWPLRALIALRRVKSS